MTERLTKLSRSVDGSTVIVTGAASGMGRATAHLFADEGAKVALIDIDESGLNRVADEIRTVSDNVLCLVVDLSDRLSVERAVSHVIEHYGGLDILVNNAGLRPRQPSIATFLRGCGLGPSTSWQQRKLGQYEQHFRDYVNLITREW